MPTLDGGSGSGPGPTPTPVDPHGSIPFATLESDERMPVYAGDFSSRSVPSVGPELESALDRMLREPPAWLDLAAARVDDELLGRVVTGPTLVLGIGGSALGARAAVEFAQVAGLRPGPIRILDTVDPWPVADALEWAVGCQAKLMVVSKSGTTVEVASLLDASLARGLEVGTSISDPVDATGTTAIRERVLNSRPSALTELTIPPAVGGRWSVLTAVGQAPLRAAGLDGRELLDGALVELARIGGGGPGRMALLGSIAWRLAYPAAHALVWCYSEVLVAWAAWLQQLECESLGRVRADGSRTGELVCLLRGPADQHSVAQLLLDGPRSGRITIVDFDDDAGDFVSLSELARLRMIERDACFASMTLPTRRMLVRDRGLSSLGALYLHGMIETALVATVMGISPYGQPAVESIKQAIRARQG